MKSIVDLLKRGDARVTCGDRWMYWNDVKNAWEVRIKEYRKRDSRVLIETESEEEAVERMK